jgi:predicted phosphatase
MMKLQMPEQNQPVVGGLFDGKKLFDAMQAVTTTELNEFFKYIVVRPEKYAGNTWKLSEIFATWMVNKTPQVITR